MLQVPVNALLNDLLLHGGSGGASVGFHGVIVPSEATSLGESHRPGHNLISMPPIAGNRRVGDASGGAKRALGGSTDGRQERRPRRPQILSAENQGRERCVGPWGRSGWAGSSWVGV